MSVVPFDKNKFNIEAVILAGILHGLLSSHSLTPNDFENPVWANVFKTIQKVSAAGRPSPAVISKTINLTQQQLALLEKAPSTADIELCLIEIKKASLLKKIKSCLHMIISGQNPNKMLTELQDSIRLYKSPISNALIPAGTLLDEYLNKSDPGWGIPYGLPSIDAWTKGIQPRRLVIIAGRPGTGKTSLAVQIAANAALTRRVAFFSLEMGADEIIEKALCCLSGLPIDEIHQNGIPQETETDFRNSGLLICDSPDQKPEAIHNSCRMVMECGGLDLVVIDYLQLLSLRRRTESRQIELEDICRSLKVMAGDLEVPVIALSQLSRDSVRRGGEPTLADLRGSGAIEQDADVVMFLHHNDESSKIILAKQRSGPIGDVGVAFNKPCSSFEEYEEPPF